MVDIKNATKLTIVLLVKSSDYIKSVYKNMVSLNHAAKAYNIILPDYITEDCKELTEYNNTYDLLKTNGKINAEKIGSPKILIDIEKFKNIYQPVYNRSMIVASKYPFVQKAIMDGILSLKTFLECSIIDIDQRAKLHYLDKNRQLLSKFITEPHNTEYFNYNYERYLVEHYDEQTNSISYSGDIYFDIYPERLFEHMIEIPDTYNRIVKFNELGLVDISCGVDIEHDDEEYEIGFDVSEFIAD